MQGVTGSLSETKLLLIQYEPKRRQFVLQRWKARASHLFMSVLTRMAQQRARCLPRCCKLQLALCTSNWPKAVLQGSAELPHRLLPDVGLLGWARYPYTVGKQFLNSSELKCNFNRSLYGIMQKYPQVSPAVVMRNGY